jgi:predicted transglutaminase-like cysteine proteinase
MALGVVHRADAPCYIPEPKREWQGLTKKEAEQLVENNDWYNDPIGFCFDVEGKLKEKNDA